MQLRTLRAFVEVVRQGGFSQAAKVVFATQSTVSKAVKQLEDEIGVPLLDRIGHRSVLTVAGEVVFRRALKILAEHEDLTTELSELQGLSRGALRSRGAMHGGPTAGENRRKVDELTQLDAIGGSSEAGETVVLYETISGIRIRQRSTDPIEKQAIGYPGGHRNPTLFPPPCRRGASPSAEGFRSTTPPTPPSPHTPT
jgi:Bacterial regulatory helix-turn-helix protein, lysR family